MNYDREEQHCESIPLMLLRGTLQDRFKEKIMPLLDPEKKG
jgi:hypothetical protein